MYIPSFNQFIDRQEVISFMQKYSFATIVTVKDNVPSATHLPFIIKQRDEQIILLSHFAKANPQASDIDQNNALVIFTEPHAYISPQNYEKDTNVPTWNYLAVHAYGTCKLLEGKEDKSALLKETILYFEADYLKQWDNLSENYRTNMMNGITAFEVVVYDLQAKKKLSQNRTSQEKENIIGQLGKSPDTNDRDIAAYMSSLREIESKISVIQP
jgi:transcriptional regulator